MRPGRLHRQTGRLAKTVLDTPARTTGKGNSIVAGAASSANAEATSPTKRPADAIN
jgi:hypothetical protein